MFRTLAALNSDPSLSDENIHAQAILISQLLNTSKKEKEKEEKRGKGGGSGLSAIKSILKGKEEPPKNVLPEPLNPRDLPPIQRKRIPAEKIERVEILPRSIDFSLSTRNGGSGNTPDLLKPIELIQGDHRIEEDDALAISLEPRMGLLPPVNVRPKRQAFLPQEDIEAVSASLDVTKSVTLPPIRSINTVGEKILLSRDTFDFCSDLHDSSLPPFSAECLQRLFKEMGGTETGRAYPSGANLIKYNHMGRWGTIRAYIMGLKGEELKGKEEEWIRAPYRPGVEVFWIHLPSGALLRRTIEMSFPELGFTPVFPAVGMAEHIGVLACSDIRVKNNRAIQLSIKANDSIVFSFNKGLEGPGEADEEGFFSQNKPSDVMEYIPSFPVDLLVNRPNIMKYMWKNLHRDGFMCSIGYKGKREGDGREIVKAFSERVTSVTIEKDAPMIMFELNDEGDMKDLRFPEQFTLARADGIQAHIRSEHRVQAPGDRGFLRLIRGNAFFDLPPFSFQSWKVMTFPFRFKTMPIEEYIVSLNAGGKYMNIIGRTNGANVSNLIVETNIGPEKGRLKTPIMVELDTWYMMVIIQMGAPVNTWSVCCLKMDDKEPGMRIDNSFSIITERGIWKENQVDSLIRFGGKGQISFLWDVAWVHFFDTYPEKKEFLREMAHDWMITSQLQA